MTLWKYGTYKKVALEQYDTAWKQYRGFQYSMTGFKSQPANGENLPMTCKGLQ